MDQVEEVENVGTESYKKTRGPDVDWEEEEIFRNLEEYKLSRFYQETQIDRIMSRQKCYNTEMSRTEK